MSALPKGTALPFPLDGRVRRFRALAGTIMKRLQQVGDLGDEERAAAVKRALSELYMDFFVAHPTAGDALRQYALDSEDVTDPQTVLIQSAEVICAVDPAALDAFNNEVLEPVATILDTWPPPGVMRRLPRPS